MHAGKQKTKKKKNEKGAKYTGCAKKASPWTYMASLLCVCLHTSTLLPFNRQQRGLIHTIANLSRFTIVYRYS